MRQEEGDDILESNSHIRDLTLEQLCAWYSLRSLLSTICQTATEKVETKILSFSFSEVFCNRVVWKKATGFKNSKQKNTQYDHNVLQTFVTHTATHSLFR